MSRTVPSAAPPPPPPCDVSIDAHPTAPDPLRTLRELVTRPDDDGGGSTRSGDGSSGRDVRVWPLREVEIDALWTLPATLRLLPTTKLLRICRRSQPCFA